MRGDFLVVSAWYSSTIRKNQFRSLFQKPNKAQTKRKDCLLFWLLACNGMRVESQPHARLVGTARAKSERPTHVPCVMATPATTRKETCAQSNPDRGIEKSRDICQHSLQEERLAAENHIGASGIPCAITISCPSIWMMNSEQYELFLKTVSIILREKN